MESVYSKMLKTMYILQQTKPSQQCIDRLPRILAHCGLGTSRGDIDLGQHWLRQWLAAKRHQAVTWTNVYLLPTSSDFIWWRFHKRYLGHQSLKLIWKLLIWNFIEIFQAFSLRVEKQSVIAADDHPNRLIAHPSCREQEDNAGYSLDWAVIGSV